MCRWLFSHVPNKDKEKTKEKIEKIQKNTRIYLPREHKLFVITFWIKVTKDTEPKELKQENFRVHTKYTITINRSEWMPERPTRKA